MDERERNVAEIMVEMANGPKLGMMQMPATGKLSEIVLPDNSKLNAGNGNMDLIPPLNRANSDKRKREKEGFPQDRRKSKKKDASIGQSVYHLFSAIRYAMISQRAGEIEETDVNAGAMTEKHLPTLTTPQIVELVRLNPGDQSIIKMNRLVLIDVIRQCLKLLSSGTSTFGAKDWKPLVAYEKDSRHWSWIGPAAPVHLSSDDPADKKMSLKPWGIPQETRVKLATCVAAWLQQNEETLLRVANLPPPPAILVPIDMTERFQGIRHKNSTFRTISPSSEQARDYFRLEEALRYSIPDRAFPYTAADGSKSMVAPLRGFANAPIKPRMHHLLKENRPPSFSILCLVRDATARLPGGIGTKNDIFTLAKDSAFIDEEADDDSIVTGALDRLKSERDPCVTHDKRTRLWRYLHRDREVEDFLLEPTSTEIVKLDE